MISHEITLTSDEETEAQGMHGSNLPKVVRFGTGGSGTRVRTLRSQPPTLPLPGGAAEQRADSLYRSGDCEYGEP